MLITMMKIEYDSVFEVVQAQRMLEKLDGIKRERDRMYGRLKFEITQEQHDFPKRCGVGFVPQCNNLSWPHLSLLYLVCCFHLNKIT
jgi:hypothetical protein